MQLIANAVPEFRQEPIVSIIGYDLVFDYKGKGYHLTNLFSSIGVSHIEESLVTWETWVRNGELEKYKRQFEAYR